MSYVHDIIIKVPLYTLASVFDTTFRCIDHQGVNVETSVLTKNMLENWYLMVKMACN